jgi:hypothetical protein
LGEPGLWTAPLAGFERRVADLRRREEVGVLDEPVFVPGAVAGEEIEALSPW